MTDLPLYTDYDFAYAYLRKIAVEFAEEGEHSPYCWRVHGWCAVIKVLDALESRNGLVNPARMDTCTHYGIDSGGTDYYGTSNPPQECDWNYPHCPKCGEKL